MDIFNYLKNDHRHVSELMEKVLAARSAHRREELLEDIKRELTLHAETEQATFYAALENARPTAENIEDAEDDHGEIKQYLVQLANMSAESAKWLEVFGEFKHAVEHHVKYEESRIFDKARQLINPQEAQQLARDMDRMKHHVMA